MARRSIATPCPVPGSLDHLLNTDLGDNTTLADVTTAFRASFRDVKPRRRQNQLVQFTIHEDAEEVQKRERAVRANLLQPPKRVQISRTSQDASSTSPRVQRQTSAKSANKTTTPRSGFSSTAVCATDKLKARLSTLPESAIKHSNARPMRTPAEAVRPARRGTIFIPNDDTTMPSMYMGIFSPIKDLEQQPAISEKPNSVELTGIAAQMAMKRTSRKSILSVPPRRGVLQSSSCVLQETAYVEDRYGQGGGKENVPPGMSELNRFLTTTNRKDISPSNKRKAQRVSISLNEKSSVCMPTTSSMLKHESLKSSSTTSKGSHLRPAWNGGVRTKQPDVYSGLQKSPQSVSPPCTAPVTCKPRVPTRFVQQVVSMVPTLQDYTILQENLISPVLYEESWLQHQEAAVTQLINNLFSQAKSDDNDDYYTLRNRLLKSYSAPSTALLYKRLQAALLYGPLSIPQDTLEQGARLQKDIGLRKQFVELWLRTYDLTVLQAALEIVIGRERRTERSRASADVESTTKPSKLSLCTFIEAFLIRNEDGRPGPEVSSRSAWSYQRTVLRSLLLIKLLDTAKTDVMVGMHGRLFQKSSSYKTSTSVVQALFQMLNPAVGDPLRSLSHIEYTVGHIQHSLAEYDYHIDNLAVDLRDGICLTRLVELLLYPSTSQSLDRYDGGTTTILLPEGETLEHSNGQEWPLSQHLKENRQSHIVKLWNVQLALSAIKNVKGMNVLIDGIEAIDIVNGFREKTIRLLWALVGKWGLSGLVNWADMKWEIRRLEQGSKILRTDDFCSDDDLDTEKCSAEICKSLLKRWSQAVACSKGLEVRNFTTSFANGKVFEAIIDEYEPYITSDETQPRKKLSLQTRLSQLGCSDQFSQLFAQTHTNHIFDRDFVLAALAFLCSRLLAPSRRSRAATVIQKAWRKHWFKIEESRKRQKKQVAVACASLVTSRTESTDLNGVRKPTENGLSKQIHPNIDTWGPISPASTNGDIWLSL